MGNSRRNHCLRWSRFPVKAMKIRATMRPLRHQKVLCQRRGKRTCLILLLDFGKCFTNIIHVASRRQPPAPHRWALLLEFSSIAVAPRQEPLCGRHGLNDVVLTPSRPLVTANDVGHWDQKHPKVLIVGKKNAKNLIAMYSGPTQFKK